MICIAVFDTNNKNQRQLREWIIKYLIRADRESDMLWFTEHISGERLKKYAGRISIALISLDDEFSTETGRELYRINNSCRIFYYRAAPCALEPLLPSRPIGFYLWEQGGAVFEEKLGSVMDEISEANDIFKYETRKELYLIPFRNILYAQSDLKYVKIRMTDGSDKQFFAKLSQVEPFLNRGFIRIHKSYIVNETHIVTTDKKEHMVILSNGEALPISDAHYDNVMRRLREL